MASPPFQMEDQANEEFFDKLVNGDDTGIVESGAILVENEGLAEIKAFSNLSIGEVDVGKGDSSASVDLGVNREKESDGGGFPASLDGHEDNFLAKEGADNVVQSNDVTFEANDKLDSKNSNNSLSSGTGVKEVDWSSFNSPSHLHSGRGTGSYSDFFNDLGDSSEDLHGKEASNSELASNNAVTLPENMAYDLSSFSSVQNKEGQSYRSQMEHPIVGHDLNSSQYWENLYPGWRYDPNTGQWHQLQGYDVNVNSQEHFDSRTGSACDDIFMEQRSDAYYFQQTAQSALGNVSESTTANITNWNQGSHQNIEYPAHVVFDPQYPGWYYDTISQEWQLLESYNAAMNQLNSVHSQQNQYGIVSSGESLPQVSNSVNDNLIQVGKFDSQGLSSQGELIGWEGSVSDYNHQNRNTWQAASPPNSGVIGISDNQESLHLFDSNYHVNISTNQQNQQMSFKPSGTATLTEETSQRCGSPNDNSGSQSLTPAAKFSQHRNQQNWEPSQQMYFSPSYSDSKKSPSFPDQPLQSGSQFPYASTEGRSSAERPPHALVTFGFGGKLIVMKENSSFTNSAYGGQVSAGGVINILNLMDVVDEANASSTGSGTCNYFCTLCQQSFPGPLVGGNVGSREVNKWIDEKIANCESPDMDYRKGELRLLFSLLKIACQHYGKLRSRFGTDQALKESDCPEAAVVKLFASAKGNCSEYGASSGCLQSFPSEGEKQDTALKVQKLLVSGRIKEALQCAKEGQLWGPALVLAAQLGDQFYGDTVKQMALCRLVVGSPLRTLCLLIARQPADIFSNTISNNSLPGVVNISQPSSEIGAICMLDNLKENLAIITANRTKDDELVVIHLGDCLWKERSEVTAAHICYLVAEANFESYSDNARICLIGADHWRFPRTYASPEAIQRTEIYEYSKVLGNPQFFLLPFQPYKLIYAYMLAEVGKVSDSFRYCQAILKCLKTSWVPEVDTWRNLVSSLEERIKVHQQGGYSINLAPAKLVGKLLNLFDTTAHRVMGGLPPPVPSTSNSNAQYNQHDGQKVGIRVSNSQSTMAMSSLMSSESMEPISEWKGAIQNRSISEPDFGKSPRKVDPSMEGGSDLQEKAWGGIGSSRFSRFGSQLFQKTVGLVLRSRPDRQAKLGEKNKFYYDEKLKRWVEEGTEPPAEEPALVPPPTSAAFQNRTPNYAFKDGPNFDNLHSDGGIEHKNPLSSECNSGIPPIPPSSNQFSARGRVGVHARYVDTFNKGGGTPSNLFQSPSLSAAKLAVVSNAKIFIPTPVTSQDKMVQATGENLQEAVVRNESPPTSVEGKSLSPSSSTTSPLPTMRRSPSVDYISNRGTGVMTNSKSSIPPHSRRTVSWSGSCLDTYNPSRTTETKPLGEEPGTPQSLIMPGDSSSMSLSVNGSSPEGHSPGDELHEVEL